MAGGATHRRGGGGILRWVVRGTLALLVTGVALWWSFKDVHFDVVVPRLKQSAPGAMLLFAFVLVFTHFVRVLRWGLLVKPLGPTTNRDILAAGTVGIPATFFVPLRLGEFVRPLMIARSGVPFAGGLASVVVERCDVGDETDVIALLSRVRREHGPALRLRPRRRRR